MGMFRRSRKSTTPFRRRQQEIAQQEAELREKLDKLERMVLKGRPIAQNKSPAPHEAQPVRDDPGQKQFNVSVALQGGHLLDASQSRRKPRSLRKVRREGQIIFLLLLMALAAAVMWLISHLHS